MSSDEPTQIPKDAPAPHAQERVDAPPPPPVESAAAAPAGDFVEQHPEALVAGAFAGAFIFAKLLRRIGR